MLGVVVVGGIYSPQPPRSRWGRLLAMGAPDSLVRHRTGPVQCPVHRHVT
jgi:ribosome biogenesis SPOUT family RNA methylase Rps3